MHRKVINDLTGYSPHILKISSEREAQANVNEKRAEVRKREERKCSLPLDTHFRSLAQSGDWGR